MAAPAFPGEGFPQSSYSYATVVSFSDTESLTSACRAFFFSHGGGTNHSISVVLDGDGSTVIIPAVPSGTLLPLRVRRFNATDTTAPAGSVIALW